MNMNNDKWKIQGEGPVVKEVWEDFYGNLWFTTNIDADGIRYGYARLYGMPDCAEWGTFDINYLKESTGENSIWQVPKRNWKNIETYEKGLLVNTTETHKDEVLVNITDEED